MTKKDYSEYEAKEELGALSFNRKRLRVYTLPFIVKVLTFAP